MKVWCYHEFNAIMLECDNEINNNDMTEKEMFIGKMKTRTKKFAVDVIRFCDSLKTSKASSVITYQLVKSATSTGANYRAACKARSKNDFFSKLCIVVEEADELRSNHEYHNILIINE